MLEVQAVDAGDHRGDRKDRRPRGDPPHVVVLPGAHPGLLRAEDRVQQFVQVRISVSVRCRISTPCSWADTNQSRRIRAYVPHDEGAGQFSVGRRRSHSFAAAVARSPCSSSKSTEPTSRTRSNAASDWQHGFASWRTDCRLSLARVSGPIPGSGTCRHRPAPTTHHAARTRSRPHERGAQRANGGAGGRSRSQPRADSCPQLISIRIAGLLCGGDHPRSENSPAWSLTASHPNRSGVIMRRPASESSSSSSLAPSSPLLRSSRSSLVPPRFKRRLSCR